MSQFVVGYSAWLNTFLQHRGLSFPDQRTLYAYHCTYEEYIQLKHLLNQIGEFSPLVDNITACGALVLFVSEWYRREYYSELGWTWEPVWQTSGLNLSAIEISKVIPNGLERYWKRPLHRYLAGRRDFIGSLFGEGGLPFKVLRESGGRFQSLFERLLGSIDQSQLLGQTTLELVEQQIERTNLPQVFSSRPSLELIAQMVDELVGLVRRFDLDQAEQPVAHLDTVYPNWRASFPLPLDAETGSDFLNGLLKKATHEVKRRLRREDVLVLQHYWLESNSDELKVHISLPSQVVFRSKEPLNSARLELSLYEGNHLIGNFGPCYASLENGVAKVRMARRELVCTRRNTSSQLFLVASVGGVQVASNGIDRSQIGLGEVPIGFMLDGQRWLLCGQASFNCASTELLLVLPDGSNVSVLESAESMAIEERPAAFSLKAVFIKGTTTLKVIAGDHYRIKCGHQKNVEADLELIGSQLPWPTKPASVFLGPPRISWILGTPQAANDDLELYVGNKRPGNGAVQEILGSQFVSARTKDGDTLLRRKVGILPADFHLDLHRSANPKSGIIRVKTKHRCLFDVLSPSIKVKQTKFDGYIELTLTAESFPPLQVQLAVTPSLLADPIVINVPFPSSGCLAFDADGNKLSSTISLDDLLGARLYLFGHSEAATKYTIELSLFGHAARWAHYRWTYIVGSKPLEVSLFNFREVIVNLLSLHAGIDQYVNLRVFSNSQESNFRVHLYPVALEYAKTEEQLRSNLSLLESQPQPVLMLLHDPSREPIVLSSRASQGVPTAVFDMPEAVQKDGPWLVVPQKNSKLFRPIFVPGDWQLSESLRPIHSLQKAVLHFDFDASVKSFTSVFDEMAGNPAHSGWQFLRTLYDAYGYLPLATFEVWRAMMGHAAVLAMALFKFEMNANFLERIESEFPVFWEFMPIANVLKAKTVFSNFLIDNGVSEESVTNVVSGMLSRLAHAFQAYDFDVRTYLLTGTCTHVPVLPQVVLEGVIDDWYQKLIRKPEELEWPSFAGDRLAKWYKKSGQSVIPLSTHMDYRNAVIYLPVFAATVAAGNAQIADVFNESSEDVFFLRQIRDFDLEWFDSIYRYSLMNNLMRITKKDA